MKLPPAIPSKTPDYRHLTAAQLRELLAQKDAVLAQKDEELIRKEATFTETLAKTVAQKNEVIAERTHLIKLLEELLRLARIQRFTAKSEKLAFQIDLFDEVELEAAIEELTEQLGDDAPVKKPRPTRRQRGFSPELPRIRIELPLSEKEKEGATHTFFTKTKEELDFVPAQMRVLEYWQEKAVFEAFDPAAAVAPAAAEPDANVQKTIVAATRPVHPLGKCQASVNLLTQIIIGKYADGLPLYRQEGIFKRYGVDISRSNMADWIIRLENVVKPLIHLMREVQNSGDYLQGDETRIQVLKENGKTAQSQKWMWVVRGGPPGQPSVLFEYDPSRAGVVPKRLLDDFHGVFQTDGYSGYAAVCLQNGITRIGCWDHARRKFVEAVKVTESVKPAHGKPTKADIALGKIRHLYHIESKIEDLSVEEKYQARQKLSIPALNELKVWLDENVSKVMKGSLTRKAMDYCLNQWKYLTGYCSRGDLHISNVLAENAIRPFAVGRKAWLFADTTHGARASASLYSLVETAKVNGLDPYAYIHYILQRIGSAQTLEQWEALLPWNVPLEKISKKVAAFV